MDVGLHGWVFFLPPPPENSWSLYQDTLFTRGILYFKLYFLCFPRSIDGSYSTDNTSTTYPLQRTSQREGPSKHKGKTSTEPSQFVLNLRMMRRRFKHRTIDLTSRFDSITGHPVYYPSYTLVLQVRRWLDKHDPAESLSEPIPDDTEVSYEEVFRIFGPDEVFLKMKKTTNETTPSLRRPHYFPPPTFHPPLLQPLLPAPNPAIMAMFGPPVRLLNDAQLDQLEDPGSSLSLSKRFSQPNPPGQTLEHACTVSSSDNQGRRSVPTLPTQGLSHIHGSTPGPATQNYCAESIKGC